MSYLSQLAARTLHQLPSVQPRLPSRFETARREIQAEAPAPLEYATFTPSAESRQTDVASISAATAAQVAPALPRIAAADAPAAPVPHPTLDTAPTHTTLVVQPKSYTEAKSEQPATLAPAAPIEHNTVTIIERGAPTVNSTTIVEQHAVIERDAPTVSSNITIEQHTLIEQRTLLEHERLLVPMPAAPPEARAPRLTPHVTPYVPPAPEYAPPAEPAPVIQVSIGRIEVRAMHTPAASPPPASAPRPGLSLDEYLRGGRS